MLVLYLYYVEFSKNSLEIFADLHVRVDATRGIIYGILKSRRTTQTILPAGENYKSVLAIHVWCETIFRNPDAASIIIFRRSRAR